MNKATFPLLACLALPMLLGITSCGQKKAAILKDCAIHHDEEFGGAFIEISRDDFNKKGFAFGDSLNVCFSNGTEYEDIGYYSGYYVAAGQELVVGYPDYEYIKFCINYGDDIWKIHDLDESMTCTLTVHQKGKYKAIEDLLSISYSNDRTDYESDEEFANFRSIEVGGIAPGTLYRGASPIDNRKKRASTVDHLLDEYNVATVLDLADSRSTIDSFYAKEDFASPYFKGLDEDGQVMPLGMGAAYKNEDFSNKLKNMLLGMLEKEAPYYIHCLEGKDRTGYVCMIIEAMCGATYDDLVDDYFITYKNYYKIDQEKDPEKYELIKTIHIDEMIRYAFDFGEQVNLLTANYKSQVDDYLQYIGLEEEQIHNLADKLKGNLS